MSVIEDLIRRITEKPGQGTAELAAATSMPSTAVLALLKREPQVEMRGRKWYPCPTPASAMPDRALPPQQDEVREHQPADAKAEHPATLKAARVVLMEVAGMLCGALGLPLPDVPPILPEIEEMVRDLQHMPQRQLAHALGEIADPVRDGEMQRLLGKVKRMHSAMARVRERLAGAIEAGTEILDLLAEERAE